MRVEGFFSPYCCLLQTKYRERLLKNDGKRRTVYLEELKGVLISVKAECKIKTKKRQMRFVIRMLVCSAKVAIAVC